MSIVSWTTVECNSDKCANWTYLGFRAGSVEPMIDDQWEVVHGMQPEPLFFCRKCKPSYKLRLLREASQLRERVYVLCQCGDDERMWRIFHKSTGRLLRREESYRRAYGPSMLERIAENARGLADRDANLEK